MKKISSWVLIIGFILLSVQVIARGQETDPVNPDPAEPVRPMYEEPYLPDLDLEFKCDHCSLQFWEESELDAHRDECLYDPINDLCDSCEEMRAEIEEREGYVRDQEEALRNLRDAKRAAEQSGDWHRVLELRDEIYEAEWVLEMEQDALTIKRNEFEYYGCTFNPNNSCPWRE